MMRARSTPTMFVYTGLAAAVGAVWFRDEVKLFKGQAGIASKQHRLIRVHDCSQSIAAAVTWLPGATTSPRPRTNVPPEHFRPRDQAGAKDELFLGVCGSNRPTKWNRRTIIAGTGTIEPSEARDHERLGRPDQFGGPRHTLFKIESAVPSKMRRFSAWGIFSASIDDTALSIDPKRCG